MREMQFREFRRDSLKTLASLWSIRTIIALGAGAYAGLRSTGPDMELTADNYFDDSRLMDFRMQGNFGIVPEDIEAMQALEWVDEAEGGYSLDATLTLGENYIVKLHSLSPLGLNAPKVVNGTLPQQANECALEQRTMASFGLALGDKITLDTSAGALEDPLAGTTFTITAVVDSPLYISLERGTSSIGNGSVDAFMLLPEAAFQIEYFTDLYIRSDQLAPLNTFSREYTDAVDRLRPELEAVAEKRGEIRYDEIYN